MASGTGIWTQELLKIGNKITALDASQAVIEINRHKLNSPNVKYSQVDLFAWEPEAEYDLVFFSFWLSHVPPELLDLFLNKVYKSVSARGKLFMIDSRFEPTSTAKNHILENEKSIYQNRKLNDGQEYKIVKVFYQPDTLRSHLNKAGFQADIKITDNYFIYATATK
ncbi:hypothetical protein NIES4101_30230 [Calothrix sp. NIES-4101]|nr:hypothetical protein NIES4101_30230 [Calothrix sp. NIES-4101]